MNIYQTKFTSYPIGLGCNHLEQETAVAYHWNECVDLGVSPDTPIEISKTRAHNFEHANIETGLSLLNTGHVEKIGGGVWKLTNKTIEKW